MLIAIKKFLRYRILTTCYMVAFIGSSASGAISLKTFLIFLVLAPWYLHAASWNDYADRHIDAVNLKHAKDRPLISKDISSRQLWIIHAAGGLLALIFSFIYGPWAVLFTLAIFALDYAYSFKPFRLSDRGIISLLTLSVAYICYPFTLGYLSITNTGNFPFLLMTGLYLGFVGRLFYKDFRDVKGDKMYDKKTFLLRHGVKVTCVTSCIFGTASLLCLLVTTGFSIGIGIVLIASQIMAWFTASAIANAKSIPVQLVHIRQIARLTYTGGTALFVFYFCKNLIDVSNLYLQIVPASVGITYLAIGRIKYKHEFNQI